MDQVYVVRHKVLVEGRSARQVAKELGISRVTVKRYVDGAAPGVRKEAARARPVHDAIAERVHALLGEAPLWTGGKQRLTAKRLLALLRADGHAVGYTTVKELVAEWRRQRQEVFVPLEYRPGELAEVDFFEVLVDVGGERRKAHLFVMRLMASGRDFAWLYPRQDQVCFLDGHVRAFEHLGAVPQRIAYDNLKAAVARILVGSERVLAARFLALTTHYLFEACFARPRTGHDKGGVEARGKGIRWQELVPIPSGDSLGAISAALLARLDARQAERRTGSEHTIDALFAIERGSMLPLPTAPYRAAALRPTSVSRRGLVKLDGATYSVPSRWAGLPIDAWIGVDVIELVGPDGAVTRTRVRAGQRHVDYRDYLRELSRKPQAMRQVADALVRDLGEPYGALWRRLVDERGPRDAARAFARVLAAIESLGDDVVRARVDAALASGASVLIALYAQPPPPRALAPDALPRALADVRVDRADLADYDRLLDGGVA